RLRDPERVREVVETSSVLGEADRIGRRARDLAADPGEAVREVESGLSAELREDGDAGATFVLEYRGDRLFVERIEVQPRGLVEVRRNGLRVAVHHDRGYAALAKRRCRLDAAAIELDALTDADRSASQDHRLRAGERGGLVLLLVGRIEVRRDRFELRGAGIDHLVDGSDPPLRAQAPDVDGKHAGER